MIPERRSGMIRDAIRESVKGPIEIMFGLRNASLSRSNISIGDAQAL